MIQDNEGPWVAVLQLYTGTDDTPREGIPVSVRAAQVADDPIPHPEDSVAVPVPGQETSVPDPVRCG